MPQRDPGVYLEDIEHYAAAAVRFTSGFSLEQYLADEKTRAAVERVLEVCSEAMSNLYRVAPAVAETIPRARDINRRACAWRHATHGLGYPRPQAREHCHAARNQRSGSAGHRRAESLNVSLSTLRMPATPHRATRQRTTF
jgi:hypothetical protein